MGFTSDACGGDVDKLCGPFAPGSEPPCCSFDEEKFLDALLSGGNFDACDPAYWSAPAFISSLGKWSCETDEMAFDTDAFIWDVASGDAPGVYDSEYWSDRFPFPDVNIKGVSDCSETITERLLEMPTSQLLAECVPPGIWAKSGLPSQDEIDANLHDVRIRSGLEYALPDCEEELLELAWALLEMNLDIIEWVLCLLTGKQDLGRTCLGGLLGLDNAVQDALQGVGDALDWMSPLEEAWPWLDDLLPKSVEITVNCGILPGGTAKAWAYPIEQTIYIDGCYEWWENVSCLYCGGTDSQKMCAAIEVASLLLHELMHLCWRQIGSEEDDTCDVVALMTNTFRQVMLTRYPDAATEACCVGLSATTRFLSDNSVWLNQLCSPACLVGDGSSGNGGGPRPGPGSHIGDHPTSVKPL